MEAADLRGQAEIIVKCLLYSIVCIVFIIINCPPKQCRLFCKEPTKLAYERLCIKKKTGP